MKKLAVIIIICLLIISCVTFRPKNNPVIIRDIPICDVTDDMSIHQYLYSTTEFQIEIARYIKELIAQIKLKCQYIDMRQPP